MSGRTRVQPTSIIREYRAPDHTLLFQIERAHDEDYMIIKKSGKKKLYRISMRVFGDEYETDGLSASSDRPP